MQLGFLRRLKTFVRYVFDIISSKRQRQIINLCGRPSMDSIIKKPTCFNLYLRNKETQHCLQFIVSMKSNLQVCSVNDVIPWKQYVSVKLQQVKPIHRLRMSNGMHVTILTPK